jgi:hypothetical protein
VIGGGAVVLFLYMRRGSNSEAAAAPQGGGYSAVDPAAQAAAAQSAAMQYQTQGEIAGLQIQGNTAIALKQLDVGEHNYTTAAGLQAVMDQTRAQLALGLGSQQSTVELGRIQAGVQLASFNATEQYYGVLNGPTGPNNTTRTGIPIAAPVLPIGGPAADPIYVTQTAPGVRLTSDNGVNIPVPISRADFGLDPQGGGMHCSPMDSGCVERQTLATDKYIQAIADWQITNNKAGVVQNTPTSIGAPMAAAGGGMSVAAFGDAYSGGLPNRRGGK